MFRVVLYGQWKWSRIVVILGTVAGFAVPILSVQGASSDPTSAMKAGELLSVTQSWGVLYPVLAAAIGLLVAIATWAPDHRGRHVLALSLPLPRWRYVLLRFTAGLVLLVPAMLGVLAGALLASAAATLPPGLETYPVALAIRFSFALAVAYAVFFAVSAGTTRTAGVILAIIAAVIVVQVVASAAGIQLDISTPLQAVVMNWPGPLAIFTGRWMLIDV
jgi:hypothetical protein